MPCSRLLQERRCCSFSLPFMSYPIKQVIPLKKTLKKQKRQARCFRYGVRKCSQGGVWAAWVSLLKENVKSDWMFEVKLIWSHGTHKLMWPSLLETCQWAMIPCANQLKTWNKPNFHFKCSWVSHCSNLEIIFSFNLFREHPLSCILYQKNRNSISLGYTLLLLRAATDDINISN